MSRLRAILQASPADRASGGQEYEALVTREEDDDAVSTSSSTLREQIIETPFSWLEYGVFMLLGVAMLWAWNMFLAAAPYFAARFADSKRISTSFQSAITSISTLTNLFSMLWLANKQTNASYPLRIASALIIDIIIFTILALSTKVFTSVSAPLYLTFVLFTVFVTSFATGLIQNGAFAFAAGFGNPRYMQAIMTGQAVAGVLPSIAQIVSVLAVPEKEASGGDDGDSAKLRATSALIYFLTATLIAFVTLVSFLPLVRRHAQLAGATPVEDLTASQHSRHSVSLDLTRSITSLTQLPDPSEGHRKVVTLPHLFKALPYYSASIITCFIVTMIFPVYTSRILSNAPPLDPETPRILHPAAYIGLAFLFWNSGDLLGRLLTLVPAFQPLAQKPKFLFAFSVARVVFIPLYLLCNIYGTGAVVKSDFFYLVIVQVGFGLSNGWLASSAMMGSSSAVEGEEREAAGAFMGFCLVLGLTLGSLASFAIP